MTMQDETNLVEDAPQGLLSDDSVAIIVGLAVLLLILGITTFYGEIAFDKKGNPFMASSLNSWLDKPGGWEWNPIHAFTGTSEKPKAIYKGVVGVALLLGIFFTALSRWMRPKADYLSYLVGFLILIALGTAANILAGQTVIKSYSLSYALWALLIGLIIGNTIKKEAFGKYGKAAFRTELYIKTGLVFLGAEVLFSRLLALGPAGILIAWVVTPIVLLTTFWFGQKVLRMKSASLNMVIAADMSVCGISAAIATAAACKAKKEELSVAVGLSLCFTAVMMTVMPMAVSWLELGPEIGGAWVGGTVDATGAVSLAGATMGPIAMETAVVVKMIQNILIGVIAFGVAAYWTTREDQANSDGEKAKSNIQISEIWIRFPKFVLGFIGASILFSIIFSVAPQGEEIVNGVIKNTKILRDWLFCLAFVCIGIDLNYQKLASQLSGGKPLILYVCGQTLNIILTLLMAILAFKYLFPGAAE
ncbi:MAG: putative sulfate exporter family transporter [Blastopirellula sp.]|nr:MAG: putative sulfate exporter family transporter [Blastopirellula sp.]